MDFLLILSGRTSPTLCSILCCLPKKGIGKLYPCMTHGTHLVLPVDNSKDGLILCLDMPIRASGEFMVCSLHRWIRPMGHITVLLPVFNPDVGLPNVFPIEKSGQILMPMAMTMLSRLSPAISTEALLQKSLMRTRVVRILKRTWHPR